MSTASTSKTATTKPRTESAEPKTKAPTSGKGEGGKKRSPTSALRDATATAANSDQEQATSGAGEGPEGPSGLWDLKGHIEAAKELLRGAQEKVEAAKAQLTGLVEHNAVQGAVQWWQERDTRPADQPDDARATIDRLELIARTFDGLTVPVGGYEVALGAELALNFVPGGQWISSGAHGYMIFEAIRFGAPWKLIQTMISRMTVDGAFSTIPVAGVIYDALRMAHSRNARELSEWLADQLPLGEEPSAQKSSGEPTGATATA